MHMTGLTQHQNPSATTTHPPTMTLWKAPGNVVVTPAAHIGTTNKTALWHRNTHKKASAAAPAALMNTHQLMLRAGCGAVPGNKALNKLF